MTPIPLTKKEAGNSQPLFQNMMVVSLSDQRTDWLTRTVRDRRRHHREVSYCEGVLR